MRTRALLAALALPLVLAAGCGSDTSGTASDGATDPATTPTETTPTETTPTETAPASPSPTKPARPQGPACEDVWQSGNMLPGGYEGCYVGAKLVKPDSRYCEFGKPLFTYADHFYAVPRGTIAESQTVLLKDAAYLDVLAKCSG